MDKIQTPNSSNITHVAYYNKYSILEIHFHNKRTYHYYKVKRRVYEAFVHALNENSSVGKVFHKLVNRKYTFKEITPKPKR